MRLFYLPNEGREGDQVGPRQAFEHELAEGRLSAYQAYSYQVERTRQPDQASALRALRSSIAAFAPDLIFWQHIHDGYALDAAFLAELKTLPGRPWLVYHEADAYGRYVKRIDRTLRSMFGACDLAVLVGLGELAQLVRGCGAPRILFSPHSVDDTRFGQPWTPTLQRRFDAVMIANLTCLKRVPGLHMPGGAQRKRLAALCHAALGHRFAVFGAGQGWAGQPYGHGPVPFAAQEATLRQSWLSLNWGQFDKLPMYASDRLVISLASGVPHICNHQPGYDELYAGARALFTVHSPAQALDVADWLLSRPREHLIEMGQQTAQFARQHFSARRVYGDLLVAIGQQMQSARARSA